MVRAVLYLALLFVASFSGAGGVVAAEDSQFDGIVRLDHNADDEAAKLIELDDCGLGSNSLPLQSFGTITIVNTLASICSNDCTRFQPIRAPPILLI